MSNATDRLLKIAQENNYTIEELIHQSRIDGFFEAIEKKAGATYTTQLIKTAQDFTEKTGKDFIDELKTSLNINE